MDKNTTYPEFSAPKGFMPPEHDGDTFDLVCTFRMKDGKKLCITKLGDMDLEEGGEKPEATEESDHKPGYGEYAQGMMSAMGQ